jgi:ABC-type branched-subunit amino acid transport system ATPase component/ABC-type branched-subunit amino acid transport system permease subunit
MTNAITQAAPRIAVALPLRERLTQVVMHPATLTAMVLGLLTAPAVLSNSSVQILAFALVSVIFAQSLFVLTGLAGQISLGHAAFFGIGAYGSALLTKSLGLSLLLSVPGAVAVGALVAFLLSFPAGRVREVYLAMMTLGFGQIFFEVAREWTPLTGGVGGFSGIPSAGLRTLSVLGMKIDEGNFFRMLVLVTVCVLLVVRNLSQSRFGRALCAIHHSEFAAGSVGIAKGRSRQFAYAVSGALAGLAGAFYAHLVGYIGPDSFGVSRSVDVLVVSIVGGMLSSAGQVVSALFFAFLPQRLQGFSEYQYIVYGLILAFSLIVLPKGVGGLLFSPPRFVRPGGLREVGDQTEDIGTPAAREGGVSLSVRDLTMRFGGLTALDRVSLDIRAGHITALVGPNGSGKSTLVNVISGIYRPTEGSVVLDGRDVTGLADYQMAAQGVVRTFQDPRLIPHFTVRENLLLGAHRSLRYGWIDAAFSLPRARNAERRELARCNAVLALLELDALADMVVESLPYGHRRMAELGRMLLAGPRILMLDEPAAGLTEVEMARLSAVVTRLKGMGLSVLLIEHHMDFLANLVDDVVVLDSGHIIYRGDMEGMRKDPEVIAAYLGDEVTGHA